MNEVNDATVICKFVGLDTHKDSITVGVADAAGGEPRHVTKIAHDLRALAKVLERLGPPATLRVVYEAGPTGYGLYRWLLASGYSAAVIAPSLIPKRAGERIKNDRRDACKLAGLERAHELRAVTVPDERDEALRDLTRAREDAVEARHRARQQLKALLLRHGVRYSGKSAWSGAHERWLARVKLPHPVQQEVFTEYWQAVQSADARVARLTARLHEAVREWRWSAVVDALMSLRGIDRVAAATLVAELGDLGRFLHPRELMGYLGLVPSEHSSGAQIARGSITKTGNLHARRMLVEVAWHYRHPARVGRALQQRQEQTAASEALRALSWRAQLRLTRRFRVLTARGLHTNKACVAVARELAGFVWAVAREAIAHPKAQAK
jgi:transposase